MSMSPDVPESIQNAALLIRHLRTKSVLTQQDREAIRKARLKVAFWACVAEKISPSHDNLVYILGSTANEVIDVHDQKVKNQKRLTPKVKPDS